MKRSVQEIIELLVFGLIAVLIGTGVLWLVGWAIGGLGALFKLLAGLIWSLLRFVVPIAVVGAAVYALVRLLQGQRGPEASASSSSSGPAASPRASKAPTAATPAPPPAEGTSTKPVEPSAKRAAVVEDTMTHDEDATEPDAPEDGARRSEDQTAAVEDEDDHRDEGEADSASEDDDEDRTG